MAKTRLTLIFQLHLKLLIQSTKRVCIIEVFFLRKYVRILLGHWKLSVIERCPHQEVRLYSGIHTANDFIPPVLLVC